MNGGRAIDRGTIEGAMDGACDHPSFLRLTGTQLGLKVDNVVICLSMMIIMMVL